MTRSKKENNNVRFLISVFYAMISFKLIRYTLNFYLVLQAPGMEYAKGYNIKRGDKNVWFKTKCYREWNPLS